MASDAFYTITSSTRQQKIGSLDKKSQLIQLYRYVYKTGEC
jgi:hypothetical protein